MTDKLLPLLGFAAKAGRLSYGMNACIGSVRSKKAKLVLVCGDISDKSKKEVAFITHNKNLGRVTLEDVTIEELSAAVGRKCGIISVCDNGFAQAILKLLGGYANDQ